MGQNNSHPIQRNHNNNNEIVNNRNHEQLPNIQVLYIK